MLLGGSGGEGMAGNMIEEGGGNRMLKGKESYRIILVPDIPVSKEHMGTHTAPGRTVLVDVLGRSEEQNFKIRIFEI